MKNALSKTIATVLIATGCFFLLPKSPALAKSGCESAQTTAQMLTCALERNETADADLDRAYQQLLSRISAGRQVRLEESQKAWIRYRDAHAAFVASSVEGGTMQKVLELSELAKMNELRAQRLGDYRN